MGKSGGIIVEIKSEATVSGINFITFVGRKKLALGLFVGYYQDGETLLFLVE